MKHNKVSRTSGKDGEGKFLQEIHIEFSCLKLRKKFLGIFKWTVKTQYSRVWTPFNGVRFREK
jgi:hypothetical protein